MSVSQRDDIVAPEQYEALVDRRGLDEYVTIVPRNCSDAELKTRWITSDIARNLEGMR